MLKSALEPFEDIVFVINDVAVKLLLTVVAPDKVVAPVTASVVLKDADVPVNAPVTSNASATVIEDESAALKVVPLIVTAPATMFPVPPGVMLISAFDIDVIELSLKVKLSMLTPPEPFPVIVTSPFVTVLVIGKIVLRGEDLRYQTYIPSPSSLADTILLKRSMSDFST